MTEQVNNAAPAPAPAPAAAEVKVAPVPEGGGIDWDAMNTGVGPGDDDGGHEVIEPEVVVPAQGEPAHAPVPATPTNPEVPPPNPATPAGEGEPAPTETPATPVVPPPPSQLTPEQVEEQKRAYAEWETAELGRLEQHYQFSPEDAAAMQTEPEVVLPKMAARLFLDVQKAALQSVANLMPQMVGQINVAQSRDNQAAEAFFSANPDLKEHGADVMKAAKFFRESNPKATPQEAIQKIGAMVRAAKGLPPLVLQEPAQTGEPAATAAPPATGTRRSVAPPIPPKPAGAGSAPAGKPAQAAPNVWADLLDEE